MTDRITVFDKFVAVRPGEMYRWLPFGTITKGGRKLVVDEQFAAGLKLPHFRPPIKLGSHDEFTPAGGHIVAFEVRSDGIYVQPEYNPAGERAVAEGHYRYHSAEIITRGALELPNGERLEAPILLGDALLHTPHLGEQAALYTAEVSEELNMSETVNVPVPLLERLLNMFQVAKPAPPAPEPPAPVTVPEEFTAQLTAAQAEAEALRAKLAEREQAEALAARVAQFTTELGAVKVDTALAVVLAALPDETTGPLMVAFKALAAQVDETALLQARGTQPAPGTEGDPRLALDAAVKAKLAETKTTDYNAALELVRAEQPALFAAAFGGKE